MNPTLKAAWLAALRSGFYKQGRGTLQSEHRAFCCLGVLCDVAHATWNAGKTAAYLDGQYLGDDELTPEARELFGLSLDEHHELVDKNDGIKGEHPHTFAEIADWIEENI